MAWRVGDEDEQGPPAPPNEAALGYPVPPGYQSAKRRARARDLGGLVRPCRVCRGTEEHRARPDGKPRTMCRRCEADYLRRYRRENWVRPKLRSTWRGMIRRCHDPRTGKWVGSAAVLGFGTFATYGARGIKVCRRWRDPGGFERFCKDVGDPPSPKHSLDRKRNTRGYSPSNVRWATAEEQGRNRRTTRWIEGPDPETGELVTLCASDWAKRLGMTQGGFQSRLKRGWTGERLLSPSIHVRVPAVPPGSDPVPF